MSSHDARDRKAEPKLTQFPKADTPTSAPHQVLPGPLLSLNPQSRDTTLSGTSLLIATNVTQAWDQGHVQGGADGKTSMSAGFSRTSLLTRWFLTSLKKCF